MHAHRQRDPLGYSNRPHMRVSTPENVEHTTPTAAWTENHVPRVPGRSRKAVSWAIPGPCGSRRGGGSQILARTWLPGSAAMASVRSSVRVRQRVCRWRSDSSSTHGNRTAEYRSRIQLRGAPRSSLVQSMRHKEVWHALGRWGDEGEGSKSNRGGYALQGERRRRRGARGKTPVRKQVGTRCGSRSRESG